MSFTIGLDLAKRVSSYAALDEEDNLVDNGKISSSMKSIEAVVSIFNTCLDFVEPSSITAWPSIHPQAIGVRR